MTTDIESIASSFLSELSRWEHFREVRDLLDWDMRTGSPRKAASLRSETVGVISDEMFRLKTSPRFGEYLLRLQDPGVASSLSKDVRRIVALEAREYERNRKIPQERYQKFAVLVAKAGAIWEEAKETSNFALYRPYLEQVVAMKREFVDYFGYREHPYDALLDEYEPGMTVAKLDPVFAYLRDETVKLLQSIVNSGCTLPGDLLVGDFDKASQRELSVQLLEQMGYDFEAGRLDESIHPFQTTINRFDARVTTNFRAHHIDFALFSTLHEGGHALYEQGINPEFAGTPLSAGASLGLHESQSRFWENMIGRSMEFWQAYYGRVQTLFPQFRDVPVSEFHKAVNEVKPSLIRIEADELTYNLHIMVRYEIEKSLVSGDIKVSDLPEIWREKMKDYLGIVPGDDATGVLQDVHWSDGSIGYFPTYTLGNVYSAQFRHQLQKEMPDYLNEIKRGNLLGIREWLKEKIHRFGNSEDPVDILTRVTGEELNAKYLVDYLNEKFRELYNL